MRVDGDEHVLSLETLYTPYALAGRLGGTSAEPQRWLRGRSARSSATGFLDAVRAVAGDDARESYEREFYLPQGYATSFAGGRLPRLRGRDPSSPATRRPINGLYLTGAATFPGAGVWGAAAATPPA